MSALHATGDCDANTCRHCAYEDERDYEVHVQRHDTEVRDCRWCREKHDCDVGDRCGATCWFDGKEGTQ